MKIGLKFQEVGHGTTTYPAYNGGPWETDNNLYKEWGNILTKLGVSGSDDHTQLKGFKYTRDGMLFFITKRAMIRRPEEDTRSNKALWIFFPGAADISPEEKLQAVNEASKMLDTPLATASKERFESYIPDIFKKDFPALRFSANSGRMTGDEFAILNYSSRNLLVKILDKGYQIKFQQYGYILLNEDEEFNSNVFHSLNHTQFKKQVYVYWPEKFPPYIKQEDEIILLVNGEEFPREGKMIEGGRTNIEIKRKGFLPLTGSVSIKESRTSMPLEFDISWDNKAWFKQFNTGIIKVRNKKSLKDLTRNCRLYLDNAYDRNLKKVNEILIGERIYIKEGEEILRVRIICPGYKGFEFTLPTNTYELPPFDLEPESKELNLSLNGYDIDILITGENTEALLKKGFTVKGNRINEIKEFDSNSLLSVAPQSSNKRMNLEQKLNKAANENKKLKRNLGRMWCYIGILIMLIAGLVVWLCLVYPKDQEKTPPTDQGTTLNPISGGSGKYNQPEPYQYLTIEEAVSYLDDHKNWDEAEMAKYKELTGLYDDLQNFRFEQITSTWKEKLRSSKNFQLIVESAQKNLRKGIDSFQGEHSNGWNKGNDKIINIQNYRYWIEEDRSGIGSPPQRTQTKEDLRPKKENVSPAKSSEGSKNSTKSNTSITTEEGERGGKDL